MRARRSSFVAASAAAVLLAIAGCGTGEDTVEGPVTVYASLPLTGPRAADGNDAADGARLALEDAGGRAGDLEVRAEFLDDAAEGRVWDPVAVGRNARAAAQDSSTAAYIGELDSEPTRASAPITNEAGIVQISPGAGGVDLTRPAQGYPDSPDRYRPSGDPTFVRLAAADDEVAQAAVELAAGEATSVRVESDGSLYGDLLAEEMTREAEGAGLEVRDGGDGEAGAVLSAGDGIQVSVGGATTTLTGVLEAPNLPDPQFATGFRDAYGREPGPYAAYGYEAMALALDAIAGAGGDGEFRPAIRAEVLGGDRAESVLGPYVVSDEGDSGLCSVQPYESGGGDLGRVARPLC